MGKYLDLAKTVPSKPAISCNELGPLAIAKIPDTYVKEDSPECAHAAGCPHTFAQLMEEFQRAGRLRVEYEGMAVTLVRSGEHGEDGDGTTYTLSEWSTIARLPHDEIRLIHKLRTIGGSGGSAKLEDAK